MQTWLKALSSNFDVMLSPEIIEEKGGGLESILDELSKEDAKDKDKGEDLLAEDKDEKEKDDEEGTRQKDKEDKEEEEVELEESEEETDDEKLELITPVPRKAILKEYPDIFKKFPYLETAMYREQAYTEILPTIEDAKEAVDRAKTFERFEGEIFSGNSESLLKAVKEADSQAFAKIVDNYLPALQKADEKSYYHVVGNVIKSTIISMAQEASKSQNDNLKAAAQILNQYIFGTSDFVPPQNLVQGRPEQDEERVKLQEERAQFIQEKFETTKDDLSGRVQNILKSTISQHIDPRGTMSDYVKKNAVKDALEDLEGRIGEDGRFATIKDKLWENAFNSNFSKKSVDAIRNAYLSKSKSFLPSVIQKARNDALKGLGKRVRNDDDKDETRPRARLKSTNREDDDEPTSKNKVPKGMSTREFLMQD